MARRTPSADSTPVRPYYRCDQPDGITAPDLSKTCTYAAHIVHARGKRTRFTSIGQDPGKLRRFGPCLYGVERMLLDADGHETIEHEALMEALRRAAREESKAERARAIQALRYARAASEGLIDWAFQPTSVERKDLITWTYSRIQTYFRRL